MVQRIRFAAPAVLAAATIGLTAQPRQMTPVGDGPRVAPLSDTAHNAGDVAAALPDAAAGGFVQRFSPGPAPPAGGVPQAQSAGKQPVPVKSIIEKLAARETEFQEALSHYAWRQSVLTEELNPDGTPQSGQWSLVEDTFPSARGGRAWFAVSAPVATLRHVALTANDMKDLHEVQPFVLTSNELELYDIRYIGRERLDELDTYRFEVKPKRLVAGKRYFQGTIWVDDRDFQIVKTFGKGVGIVKENNAFPRFETYREQIDGKYWFPTYTHADDTLKFSNGNRQRIRMTVKYRDYRISERN